MALPFTLGAISRLLVAPGGYQGFDRPSTTQAVSLLSDGVTTGDQVLQSGSTPFRRASVSGVLTEAADVTLLRGYNDTKDPVLFTDGDGETWDVRVLDLTTRGHTGWWDFDALLIESDTPVGS